MQTFTLLVHRDVDARLAELDVSLRESVRQKVIWAETQLAMTGRAPRVKGTNAQAWRRTPVRGNEYYLWWAPADAAGGASVVIRDLRHHDRLVAPSPAAPHDYRVVHPRELDPRTPLQASVTRDAVPSGITARLVRGQPGTGKTLALLYAARDLAASQRVLYVTYTPRLAEEARMFAHANGIGAQIEVITLSGLLAAILREAESAKAESPQGLAERFESLVRSVDTTVVGPWLGKGHSLWAEARANLVGMALPFAWRRGPLMIPPCEMLERELYRKVSGLDEDAADRAHHLAEIALRRGLLSDQTRARAALLALVGDNPGDLDLERVGAVLVDEVQDLTPVEIALLLEVARRAAQRSRSMLFVAAGDESQTVHPSGFEWGIAKDLVHQRLEREPGDIALRLAMRNPREVSALVQKTAALYKLLSKELRPSGATPEEATEGMDLGRVLRCEPPDDAAFQALLGVLVAMPGRVLVTLGEPSEKSDRTASGAEITFTPAEIKGLERRTVIVTGLHEALGALGRLTSRAEQEGRFLDGLEARHLVDSVRVVLSRATETLVLLGPALSGPHAAQVDLTRDVETVPWAELLRLLQEDDLTDVERALGFLDEAREHEERDDAGRAIERLERAEAIAHRLQDPALEAAARELRARLDAKSRPRAVVAPSGGDFDSLQDAIDAMPAGAMLLIRPGTYEGPFMFDRDIEIVGDGECGAIVLESTVELAVAVEGCKVALENVTIRRHQGKEGSGIGASILNAGRSLVKLGRGMMQAAGITVGEGAVAAALELATQEGLLRHAVTVIHGEIRLRRCDIDAGSGTETGVSVGLQGYAHVESCQIHDGSVGVFVGPEGHVIVEGSEIFSNNRGILAMTGSELTVRESSVRDGVKDGIRIKAGAVALIEKSDVSMVTSGAAIHVEDGARPIVRTSRIHHAEMCGLWIGPCAGGVFEDNDVFENGLAGIKVAAAAVPTVRNNRVHHGRGSGIVILPKGGGTFEGNEIFENQEMGFVAGEGAEITVTGGVIRANGHVGIYVEPDGKGTFEGIDISAKGKKTSGIFVGARARAVLRRNRIHDHQTGVHIDGGDGEFYDNDIFENSLWGLYVKDDGHPLVRGNRFHHNHIGIFVDDGATGTFEDNDIHSHRDVGVQIYEDANPSFRGNRIRRAVKFVVCVSKGARSIFEDNDISEGGMASVAILESNPTFRGNRIHHSPRGLEIVGNALGVFEGNDIFENSELGVYVRNGAVPTLRGNRIHDNRHFGVVVEQAAGSFLENEIWRNRDIGMRTNSTEIVVTGNRIHDNSIGVFVQEGSAGLFEGNELAANKKEGLCVAPRGDPTVRSNRIHGSIHGILMYSQARGTYTDNDLRGNTGSGLGAQRGATPVSVEGNVYGKTASAAQKNGGQAKGKGGRRR